MSNLKKLKNITFKQDEDIPKGAWDTNIHNNIKQILADLYSQAYADGAVGHSRNDDILIAHKEIKQAIHQHATVEIIAELERHIEEMLFQYEYTQEYGVKIMANKLELRVKELKLEAKETQL